jgi:hypothetical protein
MFRQKDRERCAQLLEKHYAGRKFHDTRYREMLAKHLKPGSRLLDAGCGRYLTFCYEFSGFEKKGYGEVPALHSQAKSASPLERETARV